MRVNQRVPNWPRVVEIEERFCNQTEHVCWLRLTRQGNGIAKSHAQNMEHNVEYDGQFLSMKRSKVVSRLHPHTLVLIKHYADFYAIDPDQLINTAICTFVSNDKEFVKYIQELHKS